MVWEIESFLLFVGGGGGRGRVSDCVDAWGVFYEGDCVGLTPLLVGRSKDLCVAGV